MSSSSALERYGKASELLDALSAAQAEANAARAALRVRRALLSSLPDVVRDEPLDGPQGTQSARLQALTGLRDQLRRALQGRAECEPVMVELTACFGDIAAVRAAESVCRSAAATLGPSELETVRVELMRQSQADDTAAPPDKLRKLVASLEAECMAGEMNDAERMCFEMTQLRAPVEETTPLSPLDYANSIGLALRRTAAAEDARQTSSDNLMRGGLGLGIDLDAIMGTGPSKPAGTRPALISKDSSAEILSDVNLLAGSLEVASVAPTTIHPWSRSKTPNSSTDVLPVLSPQPTPASESTPPSSGGSSKSKKVKKKKKSSHKSPTDSSLGPTQDADTQVLSNMDLVKDTQPAPRARALSSSKLPNEVIRERARSASPSAEEMGTLVSELREVPSTPTAPKKESSSKNPTRGAASAVSPRSDSGNDLPAAAASPVENRSDNPVTVLAPASVGVAVASSVPPRMVPCLQLRVKKLFSVTSEAKPVKEKSSVAREKKKMEKLMKEAGVDASATNTEQAKLVNRKRADSGASVIKVKDSEALLFVRATVGKSVRRQSNYVLSNSEEATEADVLLLPVQDATDRQVQLLLCGSSGVFGPDACSVLGMMLFDTPEELAAQTAPVVLRTGRHSFEITASLGPVDLASAAYQPGVDVPTLPEFGGFVADRVRPLMVPVGTLTQDGVSNLPVPPQHFSYGKTDALRLMCDEPSLSLERIREICSLAVQKDYRPSGGKPWKNIAGFTLLHLACLAGHVPCVTMLTRGANKVIYDPELGVGNGANCYHLAVVSGSAKCLTVLLDAAADLEGALRTPWVLRMPLLHLCAALGRLECLEVILSRSKAWTNVRDLNGYTPLMWACYGGSTSVASTLLAAGASATLDDEERNTPLHMACGRGWQEIVALLLVQPGARKMLLKPNAHNQPVLWLAVTSLSPGLVQTLLQGADGAVAGSPRDDDWDSTAEIFGTFDVNQRFDVPQNTVLHRAVLLLSDDKLPPLISSLACTNKLDPNVQNSFGQTALHMALALGKTRCAERLLQCKASADVCDSFDNTPLHYALSFESVDWLFSHVDRKALNVDAVNKAGCTPLHHVFSAGTPEAVSALLAHDSDPTMTNKQQQIPFDMPASRLAFSITEEDTYAEKSGGLVWSDTSLRKSALDTLAKSPSTPSGAERRKTLTSGLSKRSSVTLKKNSGLALVLLQLGKKNF